MFKSKTIIIFLTILFIGIFGLAKASWAANYYVDGNLSSDCLGNYSIANRNCIGSDGTAWKRIYSANQNLYAGDTVYIRGGVADYQVYNVGVYYNETGWSANTQGISPAISGTSGNPITYSAYPGEKVHFLGTGVNYSYGIRLVERSYIKVTGVSGYNMKFTNLMSGFYIGGPTSAGVNPIYGAHYNEIAYSEFSHSNGYADYQMNKIRKDATYNHIHHVKIHHHGSLQNISPLHSGALIDVGFEEPARYTPFIYDRYNVIENSEFYAAGHNTISINSLRNIIRNNYTHNEAWYQSTCQAALVGYRNFYGNGPYLDGESSGHNLVEGNRIGHGSDDCPVGPLGNNSLGGGGYKIGNNHNIVRYNAFFKNVGFATYLQGYLSSYGSGKSNYNHIYNNTYFSNGWTTDSYSTNAIVFGYNNGSILWDSVYGNVIQNNLFASNHGTTWYSFANSNGDGNIAGAVNVGHNVVTPNWDDKISGNPLFVNETATDKTSWVLPDLNLQSSSPVIDGGTYLAQANGSGSNSITLIVDEARYFQDGKFGLGITWPSNISVQADWIAIGTVNNVVQISSINYNTNTITLASPMTWSNGAPIWLYKKSDGSVVLSGSAPDYGAYEYLGASPPSCVYTYSSWGACQPNGTQTRTYTAVPVGCSGTPITSQSCVYAFPPEQLIQAESGILSGMQQFTSGLDTYIYTNTTNSGSAVFAFNITTAGTYKLEARVNSNNDGGTNSFYVGLDTEAPLNNNYYAFDAQIIDGFIWDEVNRRGNGGTVSQYDPMIFNLSVGSHAFTFYGKEPNTWLDQIRLVPATGDTTAPSAPTGVSVN